MGCNCGRRKTQAVTSNNAQAELDNQRVAEAALDQLGQQVVTEAERALSSARRAVGNTRS